MEIPKFTISKLTELFESKTLPPIYFFSCKYAQTNLKAKIIVDFYTKINYLQWYAVLHGGLFLASFSIYRRLGKLPPSFIVNLSQDTSFKMHKQTKHSVAIIICNLVTSLGAAGFVYNGLLSFHLRNSALLEIEDQLVEENAEEFRRFLDDKFN